jgi:hypothetical protein
MSTKKFVTETNTQVYSRFKIEEKAASELAQSQQQIERENRSLKRVMSKQYSSTAERMSEEALKEVFAEHWVESIKVALRTQLLLIQKEKEIYNNIKIQAETTKIQVDANESRQWDISVAKQRLVQTELEALLAKAELRLMKLRVMLGLEIAIRLPIAIRTFRIAIQNF